MPFIRFVSGVVVPKVCIIQAAFLNAAHELGVKLPDDTAWVTSGNDRVHMRGSKHYTDEALDFRSKTFATAEKHKMLEVIKRRLGKDYNVLLESEGGANEHFHIEYDPA